MLLLLPNSLHSRLHFCSAFFGSVSMRWSSSLTIISLIMAKQALSTPRVLVYTATAGYRHDSIPTAIQVLGDQASSYNVSFVFSE